MLFTILWILALLHILLTWVLSIRSGLLARRRLHTPVEAKSFDMPPVSILIPAWKEKGTIERCVESLGMIDYPNWEALILAGGEDGTIEAAVQAAEGDTRFRVLERGPEPKNVAIMQGVQAARYDILVILDADSLVFPDWLSRLVEPIAAGAAASFGMHLPSKKTWISMAEHMDIIHWYSIAGSTAAQGCSSLAIRREVLARIGKLPAAAYSWEDWDIAVRLIDAGQRIVFAEKAQLMSDRPATLQEYWMAILRSYRSHLAGLWYHRAVFIRRPLLALSELYFSILSVILGLAVIACLVAVVVQPSLLSTIGTAIALLAIWILGRRAALGAEIAAYTGERKWLARAWALLLLLPIQILAAFVAMLSLRRQPSFDYKGPRLPHAAG